MKTRAQCGITAGIAIVGTSVIALTPIAPLPTETFASADAAAVTLVADPTPLESLQLLAGGVTLSGQRFVQGLGLLPLSAAAIAQGIAAGDVDAINYAIEQNIDAPLWIADPTIFALNDALPAPFGQDPDNLGEASLVNYFRVHVLYSTTTEVGAAANAAVTLAAGLGESGVRLAESLASAPLGLIPITEAIAAGNKDDLYFAIRQYIDAPLYVADPTLKALNNVLPDPYGQDPSFYGDADGNTSEITKLRNETLWTATYNVRESVRKAIGAAPGVGDETPTNDVVNVARLDSNQAADPLQEKKGLSLVKKSERTSVLGASDKKVGAHRQQTDNPVRATVKRLRESVKSASTPRHARTASPAD
jgi:hypothetical protein